MKYSLVLVGLLSVAAARPRSIPREAQNSECSCNVNCEPGTGLGDVNLCVCQLKQMNLCYQKQLDLGCEEVTVWTCPDLKTLKQDDSCDPEAPVQIPEGHCDIGLECIETDPQVTDVGWTCQPLKAVPKVELELGKEGKMCNYWIQLGFFCDAGLECVQMTCKRPKPGSKGGECIGSLKYCDEDLVCKGGTCKPSLKPGTEDGICRDTTVEPDKQACNIGLKCVKRKCKATPDVKLPEKGTLGGMCDQKSCGDGNELFCQNGICKPANGMKGGPCGMENTCGANLECISGKDQWTGGDMMLCWPPNTPLAGQGGGECRIPTGKPDPLCDAGFECVDRTCKRPDISRQLKPQPGEEDGECGFLEGSDAEQVCNEGLKCLDRICTPTEPQPGEEDGECGFLEGTDAEQVCNEGLECLRLPCTDLSDCPGVCYAPIPENGQCYFGSLDIPEKCAKGFRCGPRANEGICNVDTKPCPGICQRESNP